MMQVNKMAGSPSGAIILLAPCNALGCECKAYCSLCVASGFQIDKLVMLLLQYHVLCLFVVSHLH